MTFRVMISYRTQPAEEAEKATELRTKIEEKFAERGALAFLDRVDISAGERWRSKIAWWLSNCDAAVVLYSDGARHSPWVQHELSVLTNREQTTGDQVRIMIQPMAGVTRADLLDPADHERPYLLNEIQIPFEDAPDVANVDIDAILQAIDDASTGFSGAPDPIERQVLGILTKIDASLADVIGPRTQNPWPTDLDDKARMGLIASFFCRAPVLEAFEQQRELFRLARENGEPVAAEQLTIVSNSTVMSQFGHDLCARIHSSCYRRSGQSQRHDEDDTQGDDSPIRGKRTLVSSQYHDELVDLAVRASSMHCGHEYEEPFVLLGPLPPGTPKDIAQHIEAQLLDEIRARYRDWDPKEWLEDCTDLGTPVHIVFPINWDALEYETEVFAELQRRALFEPATFIVMPTESAGPHELLARLGDAAGLEDPSLTDAAEWPAIRDEQRSTVNLLHKHRQRLIGRDAAA